MSHLRLEYENIFKELIQYHTLMRIAMSETEDNSAASIYAVSRSSTHGAVVVKSRFTNGSAALQYAKRLCGNHSGTKGDPERFEERGENCIGGYRNDIYDWSVIEQPVFESLSEHDRLMSDED